MADQYQEIPLVNNEKDHRFEISVDGTVSFIEYKKYPHAVALLHTEVPPAMEGKGIAAALVLKTFNYMEENHLKIISLCPYVTMYLKRHPEWNRIVVPSEK